MNSTFIVTVPTLFADNAPATGSSGVNQAVPDHPKKLTLMEETDVGTKNSNRKVQKDDCLKPGAREPQKGNGGL